MDHGATAHRVTDESDSPRADRVDHGDDVITEGREVPVAAAEPPRAVTCEVDRDDVGLLGDELDLAGPIGAITGPAVRGDHRGRIDATACAVVA